MKKCHHLVINTGCNDSVIFFFVHLRLYSIPTPNPVSFVSNANQKIFFVLAGLDHRCRHVGPLRDPDHGRRVRGRQRGQNGQEFGPAQKRRLGSSPLSL